MKALLTLALLTATLTLTSCGNCPLCFKKKPAACATCCEAKPGASKTAQKH